MNALSSCRGAGLLRPPHERGAGRAQQTCAPIKTRRHRAFTLIEVLISLAILAIAAVALGAAYANTLGAHHAAAQRAATGLMVDYLREQVLNEPEREKVEAGGDLALPDNRRLRWEAKIEESLVPDLFKVTLTGRIDGGTTSAPEEQTHTLMLLRPTWSDPARRDQLRTDWRAAREEAKGK